MGIQTLLSVVVAAIFRCDKIAATMGVWLTNPLTAPAIYGAQFYVGAWLTGSDLGELKPESLDPSLLIALGGKFLWLVSIGGIAVGIPVSLVTYWLALKLIRRVRGRMATAADPAVIE